MDEQLVERVEQQIFAALPGAPAALRGVVLGDVRRELRAGEWDRWLGRAAAALIVLGVGLNGVMGLSGARDAEASLAGADRVQASLVATAAAVAEATDAETGRRVARQMAMWSGWGLTDEQAAAVDAALAAELQKRKAG